MIVKDVEKLSFLGDRLDSFMRKRLIFNICIGRSGTSHLFKMTERFRGMSSFPERLKEIHSKSPTTPEMLSAVSVMPEARENKEIVDNYVKEVVTFISELDSNIFYQTSFLTSHGIIEGFLRLGIVPDFVVLERDPSLIAQSHYKLDMIPGRSEKGLRWCLHPEQKDVKYIKNWDKLNNYQLCYWYSLENQRRQDIYSRRLRNIGSNILKINISELNNAQGVMKLIRYFDLSGFESSYSFFYWLFFFRGKKTNTKSKAKQIISAPNQLDYATLESEVETLFYG